MKYRQNSRIRFALKSNRNYDFIERNIYIYIFDLIGRRKKKEPRLFIRYRKESSKSHSEGESFSSWLIERLYESRWHARRKKCLAYLYHQIFIRPMIISAFGRWTSLLFHVIPTSFILRPSRTWNEALFETRPAAMYYSFHYEFFFSNVHSLHSSMNSRHRSF